MKLSNSACLRPGEEEDDITEALFFLNKGVGTVESFFFALEACFLEEGAGGMVSGGIAAP